ncbi:MAG: pilus assembly protein TadG-related protein [Cryobacterium sp.]
MTFRTAARDEDGSTLILTVFYAFLALSLILVVAATTSLYRERTALFSLADGAALAGAEAFNVDAVAPGAAGAAPVLLSADVAAAVAAYLDRAPHSGFDGFTMTSAASVDGTTARVTLSSYWTPPVWTELLPRGVRVEVTAEARSVFTG